MNAQPTLTQFVLLSMVLHLLIVVLFGTSGGGGPGEARRGEAWWGQLDVTLQQLAPDRGFRSAPGAESGAPDESLFQRPEPLPLPRRPAPSETARDREAAPPAQTAPAEALPQFNPEAPEEVDKPYRPLLEPAPAIERQLSPPRAAPAAPSTPIEHIAPRATQHQAAPPAELRLREVPVVPATPIERIAPARGEREIAPPVELPPREAPVAPAAPIEGIAPRQVEREMVSPAATGLPAEAAPRAERPTVPAAAPAGAPPATAPARTEPVPAEPLPRIHLGGPQPDESMFKPRSDVVTPPTEPGGLPHINREASRQRAREIAAEGLASRHVFTLPIPPPPERESKDAKAIEKATKPDCRTAYSDLGLLATPLLLANAITESGCKW